MRSWYVALVVAITLVPVLSVLAEDSKVHVLQGRDVSLPCTSTATNSSIDWLDFANNEFDEPINVRSRINAYKETYAAKHEVDGHNRLIIRGADSKDAGKYTCRDVVTKNVIISYYVTVYSAPECSGVTSLKQGDSTNFGCKALVFGEFGCGNLQWFRRDTATSVSRSDSNDVIGVDSFDACEVAVAARNVSVRDVTYRNDGDEYICRLTFGDVVEECRLVLSVEHSVRDVQFEPVKTVYTVGEEIHCTSRGNPPPSITLQSTPQVEEKMTVKVSSSNVHRSVSSLSIKVQKSWVGLNDPIQLNCTASNTVHQKESFQTRTIIFTVTAKEPEKDGSSTTTSTSGTSLPVTIGIVIGIVILATIIAIVVCMRLRKDRKEDKESKTPPAGSAQKQDLMKNEKDGKAGNSKC